MGRAGRYTLSVMVWVAAFAAWSAAVGLVVGALSGDAQDASTPAGVGAVMYVVLSVVPTAAALWFNDWARDGFPTAQERRRADYRRADPALRDVPREPVTQPPSDAR